jgi:hypothetical protein
MLSITAGLAMPPTEKRAAGRSRAERMRGCGRLKERVFVCRALYFLLLWTGQWKIASAIMNAKISNTTAAMARSAKV